MDASYFSSKAGADADLLNEQGYSCIVCKIHCRSTLHSAHAGCLHLIIWMPNLHIDTVFWQMRRTRGLLL